MKKLKLFAAVLILLLLFGSCSSTEPLPEDDIGQSTGITDSEQSTPPDIPDSFSQESDTTETEPEQTLLPAGSGFEVHFIDVGQGDSILVLCNGKAMLIDGGEASESSRIYAYLKSKGIGYLDYIVATHAHSDHIGGLAGALNYSRVGTALCPVTSYDSKPFQSFIKYLGQQGVPITVPSAGDSFSLGSAAVQILGSQRAYEDHNDASIVMKVTYGETSFLFTGDAGRAAEADILEAGYDLSATVLKVGHHGSDTGTSYPFLRAVMPTYAVIQVGKDNSYGHPTEDTLSRLRDADVRVYRTDLQGTVICSSDGEAVSFTVERNESAQTNPTVVTPPQEDSGTSPDAGEYIGNRNSKKFHLPTCKNLPAEKNRISLASREEAIRQGFDPCGNCNP